MLKLKYLFDNRALALMLLENWVYDPARLDVLDQFRISSNAIYPFFSCGSICFLRFFSTDEKSPGDIRAELDFLAHLRKTGYPVAETLLSKQGHELETVDTPWGIYCAAVFKGVPGRRCDRLILTEDIIYNLGKSLGQLHRISSQYIPSSGQRPDWRQRFGWVKDVLQAYPEETKAREEELLLRCYLSELPTSSEDFGLIHYDFELDNLFYDDCTGMVYPIDFDDAVYHWYVMDIAQAVDSLREELPDSAHDSAVCSFLDGYRSEKAIDAALLAEMPVFRRYANLFAYARILRSVKERWRNEPEWMTALRAHLEHLLKEKKRLFGAQLKPELV